MATCRDNSVINSVAHPYDGLPFSPLMKEITYMPLQQTHVKQTVTNHTIVIRGYSLFEGSYSINHARKIPKVY